MKQTGTILDEIIMAKKQYLARRKLEKPQKEIEHELASLPPVQGAGFFDTLKTGESRLKIIAEVKQASPSAGILRDPFDLAEINQAYQAADNVVAISVLTEHDYFKGSEATLAYFAAHNTNHKPLLRKDFIFEPYQVLETKLLGAQAYLLIASLFGLAELQDLVDFGQSLGIAPLIEVHNPKELDMARQTAVRCIGVNSRDLNDFSVDVGTHKLLEGLPDIYARIAESGINSPELFEAAAAYADAALIGTQFMRATDIDAEINRIIGSPGSKT
jgi:indole-3-glycerol phosphate synthase